ncbi:hypothetical protein [Stenotrophomonas sp. ZAC14D2_NAIMI4_6]|uniref:hypothetical protein n=1 Tax=Stenotrophomonas sp. ZAC14D2_NAIMI4_6 TaxID=2072406 RepID=UPI000D540B78|nr:hypothetical protein [Stenotrophomonas sp. ZAC14D2_NAIMI4_6]AWH20751.1 hypothetical protein C1933_05685 [Stenotrophomonas sp. ZAC14D2_NAIMI4_6]
MLKKNLLIIAGVAVVIALLFVTRQGKALDFLPMVLIGLLPAAVACWKGYADRFGTWWMYGSVLWPVAMIHVTVLPWRRR